MHYKVVIVEEHWYRYWDGRARTLMRDGCTGYRDPSMGYPSLAGGGYIRDADSGDALD
jgi:hypothetical protein